MKHARDDYNRIQDPDGKIPEDEPVFLLRAQDKYASMFVRMYAMFMEAIGKNDIAELSYEQAILMAAWPVKKTPDL